MSKTAISQHALNSGELSPLLYGRVDVDRFAYGVRSMVNFIPTLQGPARKRPGFKYIHDLKERCWLMPATFAQTDAWILAFGDSKLKLFTDRGPVLESAKTITGVTSASPGVLTSNSHGFANGDEVFIEAVGGATALNGRSFIVRNQTTHTFTLEDMWGTAVDTTSMGAYTSGGTAKRHYQIVSPYPMSALTDANGCCLLSWALSEDVIYICVPGYAPRKLTRSSATSWAFSTLDQVGGPFIGTDPDETITVYSSHSTGTARTLTATAAIFTANHVGALFLLEKKLTETVTSWEAAKAITSGNIRRSQGHYYEALTSATTGAVTPAHTEGSRFDGDTGVNWQYLHSGYGWAKITAVAVDGFSATVDILSHIPAGAVGSGNPSTQWSFGAWSAAEGYPTHVCFFRERLWFARGTKLWGSVPSDFENFSERDAGIVADDSAISIDIRQGYNDEIQWIMPSSDLLVGAQGNEFSIGEISTADPLGPANIASLRGPGYGARRVQPALINDAVMYALPSGRVVRELRYAFETDGYNATNRTAFAEHITKGQINQFAFAKEPESILWASCADGALIGLSYEREHQLLAWHRQAIGGTSAFVEALAVIPSPDGDRDELYACIKRTINGATKHYLEFQSAHWDEASQTLADMTYSDSFLSSEANVSTTISGLEHLIGESVNVLGDGKSLGAEIVAPNGSVTIGSSSAPTVVHIGLGYTAELETLPMARPGFISRLTKAFVRFVSTVSAKVAGATSTERTTRALWGPRAVPWAMQGQALGAATAAQTRIIACETEGDHGQEVFFRLTHDYPTACTVAGWTFEMDVNRK